MLSTIEQFRDRLLGITARAEPHIAVRSSAGIVELDRCRSEMSRILSIYNLFVHREIFEPLLCNGSTAEAAAAKEIKVECISLVEDFRAFKAKWSMGDVAAEWEDYQPAARDFRLRIQRHLERVMAIADPALSFRHLPQAA